MDQDSPRVKIKLGTTLKLREFENVRIDFEIEDSVRPGDTDIPGSADRLYDIADAKLVEKAKAFKNL